MLELENVVELLNVIPHVVIRATRARAAAIYLLEGDRLCQAGTERVTDTELPHLRQQANDLNNAEGIGDELRVPLKIGVKPRGLLLLRGVSLSPAVMDAVGSLISVSLDRASALEDIAHNEATKESERLRTLMIDSITHELRTPLTSIKGAASILLTTQIEKEEDRRELLTIIDEESERLDKLVSQAVEMAQLDTQQVHMTMEKVDIERVIEQVQEDCGWIWEQHPVEIRIESKGHVVADAEFLRKVICNLLENAAKYSDPRSPIVISTEVESDQLILSVADKGIGIDPSEQGFIFDRFYRASIHNQKISGTGMGLSVSKAIIESHGGTMQVLSRLGEGSIFSFSLPVA
jgi:two-component system sensor histidine kinase KdpD